jgi:hypothetical protein
MTNSWNRTIVAGSLAALSAAFALAGTSLAATHATRVVHSAAVVKVPKPTPGSDQYGTPGYKSCATQAKTAFKKAVTKAAAHLNAVLNNPNSSSKAKANAKKQYTAAVDKAQAKYTKTLKHC